MDEATYKRWTQNIIEFLAQNEDIKIHISEGEEVINLYANLRHFVFSSWEAVYNYVRGFSVAIEYKKKYNKQEVKLLIKHSKEQVAHIIDIVSDYPHDRPEPSYEMDLKRAKSHLMRALDAIEKT